MNRILMNVRDIEIISHNHNLYDTQSQSQTSNLIEPNNTSNKIIKIKPFFLLKWIQVKNSKYDQKSFISIYFTALQWTCNLSLSVSLKFSTSIMYLPVSWIWHALLTNSVRPFLQFEINCVRSPIPWTHLISALAVALNHLSSP